MNVFVRMTKAVSNDLEEPHVDHEGWRQYFQRASESRVESPKQISPMSITSPRAHAPFIMWKTSTYGLEALFGKGKGPVAIV